MAKQAAEIVQFNKLAKQPAKRKKAQKEKEETKTNSMPLSLPIEKKATSHSLSSSLADTFNSKDVKEEKRPLFANDHETFVPFLTVSIVTGEILYDNRKNVYWTLKE